MRTTSVQERRRWAAVRLVPTFVVLCLLLLCGAATPATQVLGESESVSGAGFSLTGTVDAPLLPGATRPIDVVIFNPYDFDLLVRRVEVRVGPATTADGRPNPACSVEEPEPDLTVSGAFSGQVLVPANATRLLSEPQVAPDRWPALTMPDRPVNQDACQGAVFPLRSRRRRSGHEEGPRLFRCLRPGRGGARRRSGVRLLDPVGCRHRHRHHRHSRFPDQRHGPAGRDRQLRQGHLGGFQRARGWFGHRVHRRAIGGLHRGQRLRHVPGVTPGGDRHHL